MVDVMPFELETVMVKNGATFCGGSDWSDTVVVDGLLVTG